MNTMLVEEDFVPFTWTPGRGRVFTLAMLQGCRMRHGPFPLALRVLFREMTEEQLDALFEEVKAALKEPEFNTKEGIELGVGAITFLSMWHQCKPGDAAPCLGMRMYQEVQRLSASLVQAAASK